MRHVVVWKGLDEVRMEIVRLEVRDDHVRASGTQIGVAYELRYELESDLLRLELVGERSLEVELDQLDFFDLGLSPLFNSLPVWRDGLLEGGETRDYVMRFVSVPDLVVDESHQRYEPLDGRRLRYTSGDFTAVLDFDGDGIVDRYEGLAERVG
jgi:uncharacterized protein